MKSPARHSFLFLVTFIGFCALNVSILAPRSSAQAVAGAQVSGAVTDPSGAAIVGAEVTIVETDTQLARTAKTDTQGLYVLPDLPVGPYQIQVTATGFKNYLRSGVVLQVGNHVEIDVSMTVGSVSENVNVTAAASMVETRENSVAQIVDQARIVDLPLNGRQPTQLIMIAGAANPAPNGEMVGVHAFYSTINISVAGGELTGMNYLLDGADNNQDIFNVNGPFPFPDALQEFSVDQNSVPARYGSHPGGVVNAVTKNGTNEWHGDLFEFLRNGDVNARNFFAARHDTLKRNQFGGTLGSKIITDKLFFFTGFQGTENRSDPVAQTAYVATAAVEAGDFSALDGPGCTGGTGKVLTDPTSGLPFANNQIPTSRFDPAAVALNKYLPVSPNPCGRVTFGVPSTGDEDQVVARVDWVQSAKHTLFGRYFWDDWRNIAYNNPTDILDNSSGTWETAQNFTIGDTYTFNGSAVNSFHATENHIGISLTPAAGAPGPSTIGVNNNPMYPSFLYFWVTGYFTLGSTNQIKQDTGENYVGFTDDVDIIRGKHQISFGGAYMRNQLNVNMGTYGNGEFTFNGQYASGKSINDALAAYMLGVQSNYQQSGLQQDATRSNEFGLYVQDTIRLTSHITINAGLRWDPALMPFDYFGRGDNFYPTFYAEGRTSQVYPNAPAGLLFVGDSGIPKGTQNDVLAEFSPRLGIVWDPGGNGRQTIRLSAVSLLDTAPAMAVTGRTFGLNSPYATTITETYVSFSNPWSTYPGGIPFPWPRPAPKNITFPTFVQYAATPLNPKTMTSQQWNLTYQRQIKRDWLASISYLGNKTTHVWTSEDYNASIYIPGSSAATNQRRPLYLQNPTVGQYYGPIMMADQGGNANYNALLVSLQHRLSNGFTVLTNYTWSHCLSDVDVSGSDDKSLYEQPHDRSADYGNCQFNVTQYMNTSVVAQSPFKSQFLRGWQLAPIISMHGGLPINVTIGQDISQTGVNLDRPNLVLPNAKPPAGTNPIDFINPAAFQTEATGTFGNLGRDAISGPGAVNFDLSLSRVFTFHERWKFEARAEAFNIINHTNFVGTNPTYWPTQTGIVTTTSSSTFGQIQSANDPRILQFALKLHF